MISYKHTSNILLLFLCLWLANPFSNYAQTHHDWSYNLGMYEVNIRQYTEAGTFEAFEEHLDRLEDLGLGILWLMPIHPIVEENRLGSLGSYYSVKDFKAINPEFGDLEDFKNLVDAAKSRGMYVILDWVPNHTSWDNYLTEEHPEWYVTDDNGNFTSPPGTNWSDVIQLDHSQQGLRDYMVEAMQFWVEEYGVDGFRFDAVSFVPVDFWEEVIPRLQEIKSDIFLLAEDDDVKWHHAGFDMSHGWGMYGFGHGVLKRIADGDNNAHHLHAYINDEINNFPDDAYRLYFTANHDENSWYGTTRELFGDAAEVFAVLTATVHGMPLIYSGQEAGLDKRLAFFDKDLIPWRDHPNTDLYRTLLELKKENQALWNGEAGGQLQRVMTSNNTYMYAFVREKGDDKIFVAFNLSDTDRTASLSGNTPYKGTWQDVFTEETVVFGDQTSITVPSWGYLVYEAIEADTHTEPTQSPDQFELLQNYPNPFNPVTTISYSLPQTSFVTLEIFSITGQKIAVLADGISSSGNHTIQWDVRVLLSKTFIVISLLDF